MTVAPDTPALPCTDVADAVAVLRDRGLRLSTARRLVLEALFAADGPVSAEYVSRRLRLDLSSVYRNLELLESHGLVRHVHLGHGPGLYALRGDGEQEYLYCEQCGAVRALPPAELDPVRERIRQQFGYHARFTHFPIVGTCAACSTARPRDTGATLSSPGDRPPMDETHAQYTHEHAHTHEHEHHDGTMPTHPHTAHDHVEHEHEHSHGDQVHSHPHVHEHGLEEQHQHDHDTGDRG
jgi:Fur family transcriptional regulator, ferric uptake regulator